MHNLTCTFVSSVGIYIRVMIVYYFFFFFIYHLPSPGSCGEDRLHPTAPVVGPVWMEADVCAAHTDRQDEQVPSRTTEKHLNKNQSSSALKM